MLISRIEALLSSLFALSPTESILLALSRKSIRLLADVFRKSSFADSEVLLKIAGSTKTVIREIAKIARNVTILSLYLRYLVYLLSRILNMKPLKY
ncbi:MAG: hypothetical protein R6W70_07845 [bacterium]